MSARKQLDMFAICLMVLLCATWGLQQVAVKAIGASVAPVFQMAIRSGIAAVLVGILGWSTGERWLKGKRVLFAGLLAGACFSAEFFLVAEGLRWTSASHMVLLLYTAPIFSALALHWRIPAERLGTWQWIGIGLVMIGVAAALLGPRGAALSSADYGLMLRGDLFGLCGGACWGATTVVIRTTVLSEAPPTQTLVYQLACSFVALLVFSVSQGQTHFFPSMLVWSSLIFQTIVVCVISFTVWFWLLRRYVVSAIGSLSLMTPVFGILFGWLLMDDPLTQYFAIGALLVVLGILVIQRASRRTPQPCPNQA